MTVVDPSLRVSLSVGYDVHHSPSRGWFVEHVGHGRTLMAPADLMAEIGGAIVQRTDRADRIQAAGRLTKQLTPPLAAPPHLR